MSGSMGMHGLSSDERSQHLSTHPVTVERGVLRLRAQGVAVENERFLRIEQNEIGRRARFEPAPVKPEPPRRVEGQATPEPRQ